MLLQMSLQEFLGLETLAAYNALKRFLLLVCFDFMFLQFLMIIKDFIALLATIFSLLDFSRGLVCALKIVAS